MKAKIGKEYTIIRLTHVQMARLLQIAELGETRRERPGDTEFMEELRNAINNPVESFSK